MKEKLRFLGMDVHAETIAAAIAEPDGEVRSLGTIPNRAELRGACRGENNARISESTGRRSVFGSKATSVMTVARVPAYVRHRGPSSFRASPGQV